jgi:RND family efflux transporter MFP subunit
MSKPSLIKYARRSLASVLMLAAMLAAAGCSAPQTGQPDPAPAVLVAAAAEPADPGSLAIGRVRAVERHEIAAATGGRVTALHVRVGDRVWRGQPLLLLVAEAPRLRVAAAEADVARARLALQERERFVARSTELGDVGASSALEREQARIDQAAAVAALAAAEAAAAAAREELRSVQVTAPIDGRIAARHVALSGVALPGAPLLALDGDGAREIVARVPADLAALLRQGAAVTWTDGTRGGRGVVQAVSGRAGDAGGFEVVVVADGEPPVGALVEVAFAAAGAERAAARVPLPAVVAARDGRRSVRVVDTDLRVRDVPVELVKLVAGGALVVGALRPGDSVIAAGAERIAVGSLVRPRATAR